MREATHVRPFSRLRLWLHRRRCTPRWWDTPISYVWCSAPSQTWSSPSQRRSMSSDARCSSQLKTSFSWTFGILGSGVWMARGAWWWWLLKCSGTIWVFWGCNEANEGYLYGECWRLLPCIPMLFNPTTSETLSILALYFQLSLNHHEADCIYPTPKSGLEDQLKRYLSISTPSNSAWFVCSQYSTVRIQNHASRRIQEGATRRHPKGHHGNVDSGRFKITCVPSWFRARVLYSKFHFVRYTFQIDIILSRMQLVITVCSNFQAP